MIERNAGARQIPALEVAPVLMRESGPFSPERSYLQFRRERLVFEICAAPFGTGYFVSSRLFDRRRKARASDYFIFLAVAAVIDYPLTALNAGWQWQLLLFTGVFALVWTLMRLSASGVITGLDRFMASLPVLGPIYEYFFLPDTFYRQDLNNSYREAIHAAVMQAVDEMMTGKGLRPLTAEQRRPDIREVRPA